MKTTRMAFIYGMLATGFAAAVGFAMTLPSYAQSLSAAEARQIAEDAYIYGYSLITTEVTRVQSRNVAKEEGLRAPTNQFANTTATRRLTIAASPRRMPTRYTRSPGSTFPNPRCSATRIWAIASTCSRS